ncbi:MAG: hypothetical protein JWO13_3769 [Acidobacteriales bacterium]|nr:hypothetical protein [Terriglobales bacterium]
METIRVGGRRYSDPDILSLIKETGELVDPRSNVLSQARKLTAKLRGFPGVPKDAFGRAKIMASMFGIKVEPMKLEQRKRESRDALIMPTLTGSKVILYNPDRPESRIAFSIAHEITHCFFPNSANGARFRAMVSEDSREANELERLCDLGAAELVLPEPEFRHECNSSYSLAQVPVLSRTFGTSYEATAFRLATANPGKAVAGLVRFRLRKGEQRQIAALNLQTSLFPQKANNKILEAVPKYRRQSQFLSDSCDDADSVRWNKSFNQSSVIYSAAEKRTLCTAKEELPNESGDLGRLEAIPAPYQRSEANANFPDILFFWEKI